MPFAVAVLDAPEAEDENELGDSEILLPLAVSQGDLKEHPHSCALQSPSKLQLEVSARAKKLDLSYGLNDSGNLQIPQQDSDHDNSSSSKAFQLSSKAANLKAAEMRKGAKVKDLSLVKEHVKLKRELERSEYESSSDKKPSKKTRKSCKRAKITDAESIGDVNLGRLQVLCDLSI